MLEKEIFKEKISEAAMSYYGKMLSWQHEEYIYKKLKDENPDYFLKAIEEIISNKEKPVYKNIISKIDNYKVIDYYLNKALRESIATNTKELKSIFYTEG